jgi:hypothetical protein
MIRPRRIYFWPIEDNKKIIEEEEIKPLKEFKNIIKHEENLD